jgi:aspartate oxidase
MRAESGHPMRRGEAPALLLPDISEADLRALAWECCGIVRRREELQRALRAFHTPAAAATSGGPGYARDLAGFELRNLHAVAALIAQCALWREESRGAHYRTDFPVSRPEFQRPSSTSRLTPAIRA